MLTCDRAAAGRQGATWLPMQLKTAPVPPPLSIVNWGHLVHHEIEQMLDFFSMACMRVSSSSSFAFMAFI